MSDVFEFQNLIRDPNGDTTQAVMHKAAADTLQLKLNQGYQVVRFGPCIRWKPVNHIPQRDGLPAIPHCKVCWLTRVFLRYTGYPDNAHTAMAKVDHSPVQRHPDAMGGESVLCAIHTV